MLKFFYNLAPNPMKVALLLEELGLPYEAIPVDTRKGEQHTAAFKAVNPNAKVPAIDDDGVVMFDSNAILLWLADKHARFVATDLACAERAETLSWLMLIASGIGPYSGQAVHFRIAAPEPNKKAVGRLQNRGIADMTPMHATVRANKATTVCVDDGKNKRSLVTLTPGAGRSIHGSPPWTIAASDLKSVQVFFQGSKVWVPPEAGSRIYLKEQPISP